MTKDNLELLVFHRSLAQDIGCIEGGADGIIVDLETRGKSDRQQGYNTQINHHSINDIVQLKETTNSYVICRINSLNNHSKHEIDNVIAAGADEILVPMIKTESDVEHILAFIDNRIKMGILIETKEAVNIAHYLDQYRLSRIYVGLNDLHISRQSISIFSAFIDGTVEKIRQSINNTPFGFAGLTIPGKGDPLAVEHITHELARLNSNFTFLRRSFFNDTENKHAAIEIPRILEAFKQAKKRSTSTVQYDQQKLHQAIHSILLKIT
jgi:hypothetical protein